MSAVETVSMANDGPAIGHQMTPLCDVGTYKIKLRTLRIHVYTH